MQRSNSNYETDNESAPHFRSVKKDCYSHPLIRGDSPLAVVTETAFKQFSTAPKSSASRTITHGWNVPCLTVVGLYYPISSCHVRLTQDRLSHILQVLPWVFQQLSMHVAFQDSPISATCISMDQVELEVSIFAGRGTNSEELIVELMHKQGDVMAYHKYAQQIMHALSADADTITTQPDFLSGGYENDLRRVESIDEQTFDTTTSMRETLDSLASWLSSDRYDLQRLGWESLVHMTNPRQCGVQYATVAARLLLCPGSAAQQEISQTIFQTALSFEDDRSDLALVVVAQILQVTAYTQTTCGQDILVAAIPTKNGTCNMNQNYVDGLLQTVQHGMQSHPHRAYYAIQSLLAICECIPSLRAYIYARQGLLQEAQLHGDSCHSALATASHQLLVRLQTICC